MIPTFQRREIVTESVKALGSLLGPVFDVVVVVDGSTDGTADRLRRLVLPVPLRVIEQANAGAAAARNRGARSASGEILMFLDDDMSADPNLLEAHDRAYEAGADAVLGHVPLDPRSPPTLLTPGVATWADERAARLAAGSPLALSDLLTGQISVRADVFMGIGGFDEAYTQGGLFGGEDTDFGRRLLGGGYHVMFAADAVSRQYYDVSPAAYLRQWHEAGRGDVLFMRRHPGEVEHVLRAHRPRSRWNRLVWRPLARMPAVSAVVAPAARRAALAAVRAKPGHARVVSAFFKVRDFEYWRGVQRAGGVPGPRGLRVLCYHALTDLAGTPLGEYGVPGDAFARQLRILRRVGFRFVSPGEVLRSLRGTAVVPPRSVLVTFDDCYQDLLDIGAPVLRVERVPAVAFAVAGLTGGTNLWDAALGAPSLPLLDGNGLRDLERAGIEIGVHGHSHCDLTTTVDGELEAETVGAADQLEALGLRRPRLLAYPFGEHDERVRRVAQRFDAAFTVQPGLVTEPEDLHALPRVEILRSDGSGLRFLLRVVLAGRFGGLRTSPVMRRRARALARIGKRWAARVRNTRSPR